jgi:hypothetical protein
MQHPSLRRRRFIGLTLLGLSAPAWTALAAAKGKAKAKGRAAKGKPEKLDLIAFERARVLKDAKQYLEEQPITVTASSSPRSAGGKHDYFSQADYWWPDPKNPKGPYIQRDGQSNPDNFDDHRKAMRRLSVQVPALTAAWVITKDRRFSEHALRHLRAWFVDKETHMNPSLLYSQAIIGKETGRSIGVIDTLHLVEVARAAGVLEDTGALAGPDRDGVRKWFRDYLTWMNTHPYGTKERDAENNHGTCWVMQAAEFARYVGDEKITTECRDRYKKTLLPNQMAPDGSFPRELRRTKPYGYSLFNLDVMTYVVQILSVPDDNLWAFELPDGRSIKKGMEFLYPFILDKGKWPHKPDVMYWDEWPIRHASLLFAGLALEKPEYVALWKKLPAELKVDEVIRNVPVRQPLLWVNPARKA